MREKKDLAGWRGRSPRSGQDVGLSVVKEEIGFEVDP